MAAIVGKGQNYSLSPCMYGLDTAKTDVERFYALYNTHLEAIKYGVDVDYDGVPTPINIEIPKDAQSIPLTKYNFFNNVVINVKNNSKNFYLFRMTQPTDSIYVSKKTIDAGDFTNVKGLRTGRHLLILTDNCLWVDKRQGHEYGHTRRDIILVENGKAANKPIMPYNTPETKPSVQVCAVSDVIKVVSGITINRDKDAKFKTFCFDIQNQYNVELCDININTPASTLTADNAIRISDCAKVQLDHVHINGTYSRTDYYGYGILMNNVWQSDMLNLYGRANWGIFGTNNINVANLNNCDINRYDIHCYGRDITLRNCKFSNLYNQFSSVYGTVTFDKCVFNKHVPVLLESSYNAYTPFDLVFTNCVFNIPSANNYLIDGRYLTDIRNSRPETAPKNLPNVTLTKCTINLLEPVKKFYIFRFGSVSYEGKVGHITDINITDLKVNGGKTTLKVSTKDFPHNGTIHFPMYNKTVGK